MTKENFDDGESVSVLTSILDSILRPRGQTTKVPSAQRYQLGTWFSRIRILVTASISKHLMKVLATIQDKADLTEPRNSIRQGKTTFNFNFNY